VTTEVAGNFATAGGVADVDRFFQVKLFSEGREIVA